MTAKYKAEKIVPYKGNESKTTQVKSMFDSIALTYDKLNITLSFGIDRIWRRKALNRLKKFSPKTVLDVATGTADLAILASRRLGAEKVTGIDLSEGMLSVGRKKVEKENLSGKITLLCQDCLKMEFADNSFDAVTVAFGVRNFEEIGSASCREGW